MNKILYLILIQSIILNLTAQITKKDSVYFKGQYYSAEEYKSVKENYDRYNFDERFMPGLGYGYYLPTKADSIGSFRGVTVKYLFYRDVSQNINPGPSHVTVYAKLCLLSSSVKTIEKVFLYSAGIDLSFEKNPKRFFFVPYFGFEVGGLSQKSYGTTIQFTPTAGLHLISKKNFVVDLCGGYVYPIRNFEYLAGWYGDLSLNFVLW
jgi:hypothetical protein